MYMFKKSYVAQWLPCLKGLVRGRSEAEATTEAKRSP